MSWFPGYRGMLGRAEDDGPVLGKPPAPELEEEYEKYKQELRADGGFGITSPYGNRLVKGIRCVASENLSDPTLQDLTGFAIDRFNRRRKDDPIHLVSTMKVNYQILCKVILHYITLKAFHRGWEKVAYVLVYTCYSGCKLWSTIFFAPHDDADRAFYKEVGLDLEDAKKRCSFDDRKMTLETCRQIVGSLREMAEDTTHHRLRNRVKVRVDSAADSPNAVDHVEQQSQNRAKRAKVEKDTYRQHVRKGIYCQHIYDATSTELRPAPYIPSTVVPLETVGEADFMESYFFQTTSERVGLERQLRRYDIVSLDTMYNATGSSS